MDVGAQYAGYTADIATPAANGHFTARQREIYEIVLGAQNAVLVARHDAGTQAEQLVSNCLQLHEHGTAAAEGRAAWDAISFTGSATISDWMCMTRGIFRPAVEGRNGGDRRAGAVSLPEEKIGVRIEGHAPITPTGYKLLTARLPRTAAEIEGIMASPVQADPVTEPKQQGPSGRWGAPAPASPPVPPSVPPQSTVPTGRHRQLLGSEGGWRAFLPNFPAI